MSQTYNQRSTEKLDYPVILTKFLTGGDTVVTATASAAPAGLTITVSDATTEMPLLWVSGGTVGVTYVATLTFTTAIGRIKEFDVSIEIN